MITPQEDAKGSGKHNSPLKAPRHDIGYSKPAPGKSDMEIKLLLVNDATAKSLPASSSSPYPTSHLFDLLHLTNCIPEIMLAPR